MGARSGGVAALVILLLLKFLFIALSPLLGRQAEGFEIHVGGPANLLHRQQFAAGDQMEQARGGDEPWHRTAR